MSEENDPYPWLDKNDPRRNMTDRECLERFIDLSDFDITKTEKKNLYKLLYKYKKAFSLRDEISLCQSMEVELELKDESPFFIRPFPIKESDKDIVDKEMRKGCLLGILKKGMSSYSSPIMLIPDHRKNHLAIMDDCLVFSKKKTHLKHLTDLFKALIRNGLKISPRKCKLFKKSLVYMGHQVSIIENIPHITPVKSRVEAIVKLDLPKSPKNCKQFCGMVNYLSMFLKDLQTKLIPIYHLTKKGVLFHWGELQQKAFEVIKKDLTEAPVLAMPNNEGHMVLVSDTSKIACGSALYREQKGRYRLIAYFSKKLPLSAQRYSTSELELTGIYVVQNDSEWQISPILQLFQSFLIEVAHNDWNSQFHPFHNFSNLFL